MISHLGNEVIKLLSWSASGAIASGHTPNLGNLIEI